MDARSIARCIPENRSPLRSWHDSRGSTVVEYLAILGLIAIAAIAIFRTFSSGIVVEVNRAAERAASLQGAAPGAGRGFDSPPNGRANYVTGRTHGFSSEGAKIPAQTKVIAGFPGIGKSYLASTAKDLKVVDLDSADYAWDRNPDGSVKTHVDGKRIPHPNWPKNYIDEIKKNMDSADLIEVATRADVRDLLTDHGIDFAYVYPANTPTMEKEFRQRYTNRGSPAGFMPKNIWDMAIDDCEKNGNCPHVVLDRPNHTLVDVVDLNGVRARK